jgi:hypothetical protein
MELLNWTFASKHAQSSKSASFICFLSYQNFDLANSSLILSSIRAILKSAGADLEHLVDVTVFLVDMKDYAAFNEVYNEYFKADTGKSVFFIIPRLIFLRSISNHRGCQAITIPQAPN